MKLKKWLPFLLTLMLVMSSLRFIPTTVDAAEGPANIVSESELKTDATVLDEEQDGAADSTKNETAETESEESQENRPQQEPPANDSEVDSGENNLPKTNAADADEEETGTQGGENTEAGDPAEKNSAGKNAAEEASTEVKSTEGSTEEQSAEGSTEEQSTEGSTEEESTEGSTGVELMLQDPSQVPMLTSLFPLEEKRAYLVMNDYTEEELKAVPLSVVLSRLEDSMGNPIQIEGNANIVWNFYKDENGSRIYDEYHLVGRGGTVDLSYYNSSNSYTMELIVGSGKQLDADATRYNVTVYINKIDEGLDYTLAVEKSDGSRVYIGRVNFNVEESSILKDIGISVPVAAVTLYISEDKEGRSYYLSIGSTVAGSTNMDIQVDVYRIADFLNYYEKGESLTGAITEQILNTYPGNSGGGIGGTFTMPVDPRNADNLFCIVYTDTKTGKIVAYQGILCLVVPESEFVPALGDVYAIVNGHMQSITSRRTVGGDSVAWEVDPQGRPEDGVADYRITSDSYALKDGYSRDAEYYFALDENDTIGKVVRGWWGSEEEAQNNGAEDFTAQILPADRSTSPYGCKVNFETDSLRYTVFYKNGEVARHHAYVYASSSGTGEYEDKPLVGQRDPYFQVTGAKDSQGDSYSVYAVQNYYETTYDTLYGYGYQTVFLNDVDADLSHIKPVFDVGNNMHAFVGTEQISGESEQDFSGGPVDYDVDVDQNNKRHYKVSFVKKEIEPTLYVFGPEERTIFLTDYFENRHDVLIANVGSSELTGLKVELMDAQNVKLDDYWVVGGSGNDTLAGFTETRHPSNWDGQLFNLAKIRLLPDGEGEIKGLLKISAAGQEDVCINLTGYARNPKIITEELDEAVKYVPYSFMISTNNMLYGITKETYSVASGELPDGVALNPATGEIYGVPRETGDFTINVRVDFGRAEFTPSTKTFTLTVKDNTNLNVYDASDEGYILEEHIGTELADRDFLLEDTGSDQLFVSSGVMGEFIDFWMNGEKLTRDVDYTVESGSTRITIRSQTFGKAVQGINTIAAEFREGGDLTKDLKRTAQNFRLNIQQSGAGDDSGDDQSNGDGQGEGDTISSGTSAPQTDSTGNSGKGNAQSADANSALSVTLIAHLTDAQGNSVPGVVTELHSDPKVMVSDQNGMAVFAGVEYGKHTLYAKDAAGNMLGMKEFDLLPGTAASVNDGQVIAAPGSTVTLEILIASGSGNLVFLNTRPDQQESTEQIQNEQTGTGRNAGNVATGDATNPAVWIVLLAISCIALSVVVIKKKKE